MEWYLHCIKHYTDFNGRASRREYWFFFLIDLVIAIAAGFIDQLVGIYTASGVGLVLGLYSLFIFLPNLAVTIRRLHDTGRSGWWVLIVFFPLIGWLILKVFMLLPSKIQPQDSVVTKQEF
jgi:uncharacterized membrane protein YhaH (DUF805 family)